MEKKEENVEETRKEVEENILEEKVLVSWEVAARPFKRKDKSFFTTIAIIVFLISLILIFIGEWFLIAAILSLTFLVYVLSTVEPEKIKNEITNLGVRNGERLYKWKQLKEFWFDDKYGHRVLIMETDIKPFSLLVMLLNGVGEEKVKKILSEKIKYRTVVEKNSLDRASEWLSDKIKLER